MRRCKLNQDPAFRAWVMPRLSFPALVTPALAALAQTAFDIDRVLILIHRPDRMALILRFQARFDDGELGQLLSDWWTDVEQPRQYGYRRLLRLFRRVAPLTNGAEIPTAPLTIYRGVNRKAEAAGISWTTDAWKAVWFARRLPGLGAPGGHVYAGEVAPPDVLAMFGDRQESEIIVDPRTVRAMRELRALRPSQPTGESSAVTPPEVNSCSTVRG